MPASFILSKFEQPFYLQSTGLRFTYDMSVFDLV
jgi:hypothetical protein